MEKQLKDKLLLNAENLDDLIMRLDNSDELTISLMEVHINDLIHLSHKHNWELIEEVPNKVYEIYDAKANKRLRFEIDEETGNVVKYKAGAAPTSH